MRVSSLLVLLATIACFASNVAGASPYDFDYKRLNDMRKAYRICKISFYEDGDCPKVWEKCHLPPLIDWDGDSKCKKPPKFTNKNDDAKQALNDGHDMTGDGTIDGDPDEESPDYTQGEEEAYALDEGTSMQSEDPCAMASDQRACAEALVVDAGGVVAYEADAGAISDDKDEAASLAADSGQPVIAMVLGVETTEPVTDADLIGDDSYLDETGTYEGYEDYERDYAIPTLDPLPTETEETTAQVTTP